MPQAEAAPAQRGGRSARRRARELAVQGLYQWLVGGQDAAAIEGHLAESRGPEGLDDLAARADMAHYRELLTGAIDGAAGLRTEFAPHLDRDVAALSPVEHGILLLATYELKHRSEIPYRVIINEAVELAKSFGGTEGFRYVNGVLDKVAAQLRPSEFRPRA
ncbi:MAG: transcription antitermination factor NusB [Burkholderiaceae bacterium]|jgi:N utilization substance protein B|nr:transcription antitermination factor NusB [Burkholderiaceae bacterium]